MNSLRLAQSHSWQIWKVLHTALDHNLFARGRTQLLQPCLGKIQDEAVWTVHGSGVACVRMGVDFVQLVQCVRVDIVHVPVLVCMSFMFAITQRRHIGWAYFKGGHWRKMTVDHFMYHEIIRTALKTGWCTCEHLLINYTIKWKWKIGSIFYHQQGLVTKNRLIKLPLAECTDH